MRTGGNAPATVLSLLFILAGLVVAGLTRAAVEPSGLLLTDIVPALLVLVGFLIPLSLQIARQWERAVVLRLGRLQSTRGPGMFVIVPFIDSIATWVDLRIQTTEFNAEQALTRDTVPANIDAILFWRVLEPERVALAITDYRQAILRVAQTSLREMIGSSPLSALLSERRAADEQLKVEIGRKTADWGVETISVEIRDVAIPAQLQDAMSRQAQAEREKAARVILGSAEQEVAHKFLEAALTYAGNPVALQLRAMNIIYETTKERGATILIPSAMVDSMNPGGLLGLVAAATPAAPVKSTAASATNAPLAPGVP
jgi:regulator of protease activity HflC (stomatin/prohibitin superfamily)